MHFFFFESSYQSWATKAGTHYFFFFCQQFDDKDWESLQPRQLFRRLSTGLLPLAMTSTRFVTYLWHYDAVAITSVFHLPRKRKYKWHKGNIDKLQSCPDIQRTDFAQEKVRTGSWPHQRFSCWSFLHCRFPYLLIILILRSCSKKSFSCTKAVDYCAKNKPTKQCLCIHLNVHMCACVETE